MSPNFPCHSPDWCQLYKRVCKRPCYQLRVAFLPAPHFPPSKDMQDYLHTSVSLLLWGTNALAVLPWSASVQLILDLSQHPPQDPKGELTPGRHQLDAGVPHVGEQDESMQAKVASQDGFPPSPSPPTHSPVIPPAMTARRVHGAQNPGHVPEESQTEACFVNNSRGIPSQLGD